MRLLKIKTMFVASALALTFSLPMAMISGTSYAEPWYKVRDGGGVEIRSRAHNEGHVKCVIPEGQILHRNHEQNWSRWIFVEWRKNTWLEWHYKDKNGKWCPIWDRKGWVDKQKLYDIPKPRWVL